MELTPLRTLKNKNAWLKASIHKKLNALIEILKRFIKNF